MSTVLFDVRRATWYPEVGISRYARGLLTAMLDLAPPELRIAPIDLTGSMHWEAAPTSRVGRTHGMAARVIQEQLRMHLLSRRADVMHLPWFEGPIKPRCPLVVTVHDLDTVLHPERYPWRFRAYYNSLLRTYVRTAAAIIVPSFASLDALEARWPGRPYVQMYYGVDPVFNSSADGPIDPDDRFLLYTGGWGQRKRIDVLLRAFELVTAADPDVYLVVTGDPGPEERQLIAKAKTEQIVLSGRVSDERLAELYSQAAAVVYPSALEGFGFPIIEAFACGTPVVALSAGSVPEIAGDAALLIEGDDPGDVAAAVLSLLEDEGLRRDFSSRGKARAAEFTWARTAERTLQVYRQVISSES